MSNKTQLQTNNTKLDALITRVNAAKDTAASLPEAGGSSDSFPTCKIKFTENAVWNMGSTTLRGDYDGWNYAQVDMFQSFYIYDRNTGTFSLKGVHAVEPDVEYEVLIGTVFDKGCYGRFAWSGGSVDEVIYDSNTGECCIYRINAVTSNIGATITFRTIYE